MENRFDVTIEGGRPWGFTLTGGVEFRSPLRVGKVTPGGRAAKAGLVAGDYIVTINGQPTDTLKHLEAKQVIIAAVQTVDLTCTKQLPVITSPFTKPTPTTFNFSSPIANGNKPPTPTSRTPRTPTETIQKPKPPPVVTTPVKPRGAVHPPPPPTVTTQTAPTVTSPPITSPSTQQPPQVEEECKAEPQTAQENGLDLVTADLSEWEIVECPPEEQNEQNQEQQPEEEEEEKELGEKVKEELVEEEPMEPQEVDLGVNDPAPVNDEPPEPETDTAQAPVNDEPPVPETDTAQAPVNDEPPVPETDTAQVAVTSKGPGWYKQMFQSLNESVEREHPGGTIKSNPDFANGGDSTDTPVYDYRGLRVRSGSASGSSSSRVEELKKKEVRPRSAGHADSISSSDVVAASRKPTALKTNHSGLQERTEGSRDYWKKIDQEHTERERERRNSREQRRSRSNSEHSTGRVSPDHYSAKMMHPLLREAAESNDATSSQQATGEGEVFSRISADQLHGAMENAMVMQTLESEGVPSTMLPLVKKTEPEAEAPVKKSRKKPPPGEKAKALFEFTAQSEKELSFKKGDIIDLTHSIDDNWLEGMLNGNKGIFPTTYVQVLTREQIQQLSAPPPEKPKPQAVAEYTFEAQGKRELSFERGDVLTILRQIDDNWYEGCIGDKKGIFPVSYVAVLDPQ